MWQSFIILIFKFWFKYLNVDLNICEKKRDGDNVPNQVRQVYELHKDGTMRGVLPVYQGKNGEKYLYDHL